jgi:hypothetical protein
VKPSIIKMSQPQLHTESEQPTLSFHNLPSSLPQEIKHLILRHWMAPQKLFVDGGPLNPGPQGERFLVTHSCATDSSAASLPSDLETEYDRLRHLSWLQSPKYFSAPYDFYMSHYLLALMHPDSTSFSLDHPCPNAFYESYPFPVDATADPLISLKHPDISTHGLEKIVLDFDATQYFAFFDVRAPPFKDEDEWYHDWHVHCSAKFLEKCTDLTLVFGTAYRYAHPWYYMEGYPEWEDACCRTHVCDMGIIIDWILEYAWACGYLDHISNITLEGDIQPWVSTKWEAVFEKMSTRNQECGMVADRFEVYRAANWDSIACAGLEDDMELEDWVPQENYPPECKCKRKCWEIPFSV